jgi:bzd-type benzoyl-CoA reductase N subunit
VAPFNEINEIADTIYNSAAKEWKEKRRKIAGFFCSYIPEEIIHAAGLLPYRLRPIGCKSTVEADALMSPYNCTFVKSCLEYALKGKYDFLDGLVSMNSCDHIRRLYDIWEKKVDCSFMHFLSVPHKINEDAVKWFTEEIAIFCDSLKSSFDTEITEEKLKDSIDVYNESRALLRELYSLRKRDNPPISGSETQKIVLAATSMPKEQFNPILKSLLEELKDKNVAPDSRVRLMIVGSAYDDIEFTEIIEEAGGLVVTDGLCFGSRYFMEPVETDGDLISNLARACLSRPVCSRMAGRVAQTYAFFKEMIDRYQVDGVIYQRMRQCDLWAGDSMYIHKMLEEDDIPVLTLEREYQMSGSGQIKNRLEAFIEMIEGEQ